MVSTPPAAPQRPARTPRHHRARRRRYDGRCPVARAQASAELLPAQLLGSAHRTPGGLAIPVDRPAGGPLPRPEYPPSPSASTKIRGRVRGAVRDSRGTGVEYRSVQRRTGRTSLGYEPTPDACVPCPRNGLTLPGHRLGVRWPAWRRPGSDQEPSVSAERSPWTTPSHTGQGSSTVCSRDPHLRPAATYDSSTLSSITS
jgi:hypothetical protein